MISSIRKTQESDGTYSIELVHKYPGFLTGIKADTYILTFIKNMFLEFGITVIPFFSSKGLIVRVEYGDNFEEIAFFDALQLWNYFVSTGHLYDKEINEDVCKNVPLIKDDDIENEYEEYVAGV